MQMPMKKDKKRKSSNKRTGKISKKRGVYYTSKKSIIYRNLLYKMDKNFMNIRHALNIICMYAQSQPPSYYVSGHVRWTR